MAIQFVKADPKKAISLMTTRLKAELKKQQRVLWVVPGGSNIPVVAKIMKALPDQATTRLAIMLSDERFGPLDHPDSNMKQLYDAGFESKRASVLPVLRPGVAVAETTELYGEAARIAFEAADVIIVQLGMGADGHIAGILPGSIATHPSNEWTVAYETPEFARITLTPFALRHASEAVVATFGDAKRKALQSLRNTSLSLSEQPAQLLKELPKVTIINDQMGAKA